MMRLPFEKVKKVFERGGRFEILEELGKGGFGYVYRAFDKELSEEVAIKLLKPSLAKSLEVIDRFKQEIRLTRKIKHKNVARIYDIGEINGVRYISMEFIPGRDLRDRIKKEGAFSLEESLEVMLHIARGIEAAHTEGIIHRDLKPQNILLKSDGQAIILDFGIARSSESPEASTDVESIGSPNYMSPEQATGKEADERSDIYSLGVLFFEMLTGVIPFHSKSAEEAIYQHSKVRPPTPSSLNDSIPHEIDKIVLKCLEKKPNDRYQKIEKLIEDLHSFLAKPVDGGKKKFGYDTQPVRLDEPAPKEERTILIASREQGLWEDLRTMLERLGLSVEFAKDGMQVLNLLQGSSYEMVCVDADITGIDGFEICRIMRKAPPLDKIPVILFLNRSDDQYSAFGIEAGATDSMTKPLNIHSVLRKIKEHLGV